MKQFALGFAAFLAVATVTSTANAQRDRRPEPRPRERVVVLGTTKLGPISDSDRIRVNSCAGSETERVSAIRVRAVNRPATLEFIDVTYGNGNADRITFRGTLRAGQQTNWIDLTGRGRCVRDIRVVGSSTVIIKQATIEIQGLRVMRDERDREDRREEDDRGPGRGPRDPRDDGRGPGRGPR